MARSLVVLILLFALTSYMPSYEGRKVIMSPEKKDALVLEDTSTQIVLPKDHYSSIIERGQAVATNEKLLTLNLAESYRVLKSVPSPGIGHRK